MNRIFRKIALRIGLMFLAVAVLAGVLTVVYMDRTYRNEVRGTLQKNAMSIETILPTTNDRDGVLSRLDSIEDMRVTLIDFNGGVIYDSRADAASLENHADRPEVEAALQDGTGSDIRQSDTLGTDMMYFAYRSDEQQCVIRVSLMLKSVSDYSSTLWIPMLIMLLAAFLLCLIIALFVSRSVTQHIIQLKNDTVMIADGRYKELQALHTGDELESLSVALCDMADKLRRNFEAITENNSRLEAVLRAVPGGIIAADGELRLIMANAAARNMFLMDDKPEGRHFLEVTRHAGLESIVREAVHSDGVIEREITIPRGMETLYLQVFAAPVLTEGKRYGVILLVQDITHLHKLENLRRDFVANVTHELKTPLTVIRGFVETLKDPDLPHGDIARFLDIIALESERLTRLINDVLLLSEIENIAERPLTPVDVRIGVREAFQLLQNAAGEKNQQLILNLPETAIMVSAESDRIKQLAINLIDNAVKYTPTGGSVEVSLSTIDNSALLRVADTGIGIPENNIPRLFERFYRVDTSRSRSLGGTGLGLAIVKHIVSLTGGRIVVDSLVGQGSVFTVYLPLSKSEKSSQ